MRDQYSNLTVRVAVSNAQVSNNAAQTGAIIDLQGYGACTFAITAGTIADGDATITPSLEEGNDSALGDTGAVAAADLIGTIALATFAATDDNTIKKLGYKGNKRYVRLTLTPAANASAMDIGAVAILGRPAKAPVA